MKTSAITTTTTLLALLSGLGLVACGGSEVEPRDSTQQAGLTGTQAAPAEPAPTAPDAHGFGHGRGFGPPTPDKLIARFDADHDGKLEVGEIPERMRAHLADIDTNHDGAVSQDELAAHFAAKRAEFEAKAKERFEKRDTNHDGALDAAEVGQEHWAKLSVADANGDQKLTPEELKAAFEAGKIGPMRHGHRFEHRGPAEAPAPAGSAPSEGPAQPAL